MASHVKRNEHIQRLTFKQDLYYTALSYVFLLPITIYSYCYKSFRIFVLYPIIIDILEARTRIGGKHMNINIF